MWQGSLQKKNCENNVSQIQKLIIMTCYNNKANTKQQFSTIYKQHFPGHIRSWSPNSSPYQFTRLSTTKRFQNQKI